MGNSSNGSGEATLQYRKIKFEAGRILPDAPAGEWQATVVRGKSRVSPTKNGDPMITFQVRLDKAEDEANESFEGTQLPLRVILVDDADGGTPAFAKRRTKMLLRELSAQCSFDLDIVPNELGDTQAEVESALKPFINAVEGSGLNIWTTLSDDRQDPTIKRVDVHLSRPGSSYGGGQTPPRSEE